MLIIIFWPSFYIIKKFVFYLKLSYYAFDSFFYLLSFIFFFKKSFISFLSIQIWPYRFQNWFACYVKKNSRKYHIVLHVMFMKNSIVKYNNLFSFFVNISFPSNMFLYSPYHEKLVEFMNPMANKVYVTLLCFFFFM